MVKATTPPPKFHKPANVSTPQTPHKRIYMELENVATKIHPKHTPITEEVIVDMVKRWRIGLEDSDTEADSEEEEATNSKEANKKTKTPIPLKKDNITPEEVVEVIKDFRVENKIEYT